MSVRLEDVLTDRDIEKAARDLNLQPEFVVFDRTLKVIRACIKLAVEKAEKVEGFVHARQNYHPSNCICPDHSDEPYEEA